MCRGDTGGTAQEDIAVQFWLLEALLECGIVVMWARTTIPACFKFAVWRTHSLISLLEAWNGEMLSSLLVVLSFSLFAFRFSSLKLAALALESGRRSAYCHKVHGFLGFSRNFHPFPISCMLVCMPKEFPAFSSLHLSHLLVSKPGSRFGGKDGCVLFTKPYQTVPFRHHYHRQVSQLASKPRDSNFWS